MVAFAREVRKNWLTTTRQGKTNLEQGEPDTFEETSLDGEEENPSFLRSKRGLISPRVKRHGWNLLVVLSAVTWTTIILTMIIRLSGLATADLPRIEDNCFCGNSTIEAQRNGCKFDPLALAWMPDHCRDDELTDDFNRAGLGADGAWDYWADEAGTIPLDTIGVSLLADSGGLVWVTNRWHLVHCNYYWRKLYKASSLMDPLRNTMAHIVHCGELEIERPARDLDKVDSWSTVRIFSADT